MASTVHFWLGMWCNSPRIWVQSACAMEVLPTPEGPTNSHADGYGFATNFARILFGLSNPTKSEMAFGRYFSDRDCGKGRVGVLTSHPRLSAQSVRRGIQW